MYGDSRENLLEILAAGTRGKRRGFSPGAAARHSQQARAHTESPPKTIFFHIFSSWARLNVQASTESPG